MPLRQAREFGKTLRMPTSSLEPAPWKNPCATHRRRAPGTTSRQTSEEVTKAATMNYVKSLAKQLAAADASFATGNIYGAGGGQGQP